MSVVAPGPSAGRGEIVLQPSYFTSSLFVNAFRNDVTSLVRLFTEKYNAADASSPPFSLFKKIWCDTGWMYMQFTIFDSRSRETFLHTVFRLFLERVVSTELPMTIAVSLFGFYTFFYTQPEGTSPPLYSISHVPIPYDHCMFLSSLPTTFDNPELLPFKSPISKITSILLTNKVFFLLPHSSLFPQNPRILPREICVSGDDSLHSFQQSKLPKKKGRPSKRDRYTKVQNALKRLEKMAYRESTIDTTTENTLARYADAKARLLDSDTDFDTSRLQAAISSAHESVLQGFQVANSIHSSQPSESSTAGSEHWAGPSRVERAFSDFCDPNTKHAWRGGALCLLEGAGTSTKHTTDTPVPETDADGATTQDST